MRIEIEARSRSLFQRSRQNPPKARGRQTKVGVRVEQPLPLQTYAEVAQHAVKVSIIGVYVIATPVIGEGYNWGPAIHENTGQGVSSHHCCR